jgi:hypothetical protein
MLDGEVAVVDGYGRCDLHRSEISAAQPFRLRRPAALDRIVPAAGRRPKLPFDT